MFESDADLLYQDEIHGSLFEQVEKIMEVLRLKYMKATVSYEGLQRIERFPLPDDALREAVLNAICHKDYSSGIPIQISVYKDKLYVANCGILPENLSVEKLMGKHASEPFNPNIAHVFYLSGLVESWGRGVEKMCVLCKSDLNKSEKRLITNDIVKILKPFNRKLSFKEHVQIFFVQSCPLFLDYRQSYGELFKFLKSMRKTIRSSAIFCPSRMWQVHSHFLISWKKLCGKIRLAI